MANSKAKRRSRKAAVDYPPKPYPDFPLSPNGAGQWQKKILRRVHHFGKWGRRVNGKLVRIEGDGWQAALELYQKQKDDLYAGRAPRDEIDPTAMTVGRLRELFLTAKSSQLDAKRITSRTYYEYRATADRLVSEFGADRRVDDLRPEDFAALGTSFKKQWGVTRLGNEIQKVRTIFKWGYESSHLERPAKFGPDFKKPSKTEMRRNRAANGKKFCTAVELRQLIKAAPNPVKAMLLLGINVGFGNHDCALLPLKALDLENGWVDFPRPKTGVERRGKLWPETVQALRDAIAERPTPKTEDVAANVFLTVRGRMWTSREIANPISVAVRDLMKSVGIHRKGLGFYTLRHTFRTIADATRDQVAVNYVMGHADNTMAAAYREHIDDSRLEAVAAHVHRWLYPAGHDLEQHAEEEMYF